MRTLLFLFALASCDRGASSVPDAPPESPLRGVGLHRLTDAQWRASAEALTGVSYQGELPADYVLYNYASVGAREATVSPYELEEYEAAAWAVAEAALPNGEALEAALGCWPDGPLGREDLLDDPVGLCVAPWLARLGAEAWRRPLSEGELDALLLIYEGVDAQLDQPLIAARAALASTLLSPRFLFRLEAGEPDPEGSGRRRYTDLELASRLAYYITDAPPDAALLADAAGLADDPERLREHAERLLATPAARATFTRFFAEWMDLGRLSSADKDPTLYPWFDEAARASMAEEIGLLFSEMAFDRDVPFTELLTTDIAYVDPLLAELYGVSAPGEGHERVRLPAEQARGGLMGRAGLLTINAHATLTSPTRRGKFVRARLLCQDIPPPPEGVVASLDELEAVEGSLRERLNQHANDDACAGCHALMDPIGFSLERFGPAGEWRADDNGYPIDTTATLDGATLDGAADLGEALAAHPNIAACLSTQLWRDGVGAVEELDDRDGLDVLAERAVDNGLRFQAIVLDIVTSDSFRYALASDAADAFDADAPAAFEVCSDRDDDGDGAVDEALIQACEAPWGPGLQRCGHGEWLTCVGPERGWETCDGADNDEDGAVDEALFVDITEVLFSTLTDTHSGCVESEPFSDYCYSAIHRSCGGSGCAGTGFGPVARDPVRGLAAVSCLDEGEGVVLSTTYTALAAQHSGCTSADPYGPSCNAAINRACNSQGLTTGYGPVEHSGDGAAIVCTPEATVLSTTYTALSEHVASCDGDTERMGAACHEAFHRLCRAEGYASGYGPLENSGDLAYAACLGTREDL